MISTLPFLHFLRFKTVRPCAPRCSRGRADAVVLAAVLAAFLASGGMAAQSPDLGPTDGHDLPATDLERVSAGTEAPLFALESFGGETVELAGFRGRANVVLVFYRGHW